MSQKEHQTISDFINGNLNNKQRDIVSETIKRYKTNSVAEKTNSESSVCFDSHKAWEKVYQKIDEKNTQRKITAKIFNLRNVAASVVFLVALSVFGHVLINTLKQQLSEISTDNETKEFSLPDGSLVTLNRKSTIRFPETFSGSDRTVTFSGEAFFEITKKPKKPFVIKTNNAEIIVLGTSFNVSEKTQNNITVTVKTGTVMFAKNKTESIILNKEEVGKLVGNKLSKSNNNDRNYLSWKTRVFEYKGEPLSKVVEDFNKVYRTNIVLKNAETGKKPINSTLQNKTPETALDIICAAHNLEYKKENNKIIISKKESL